METERLDDKNFLEYAARNYDNNQRVDEDEFAEDLKRFKYLKKVLARYELTGELKHRLILNHLIVLYNVFGPEALPRMLFLKMERYASQLKPFLVIMSICPEIVRAIGPGSKNFYTDEINMDQEVINSLRRDLK